jgi:hypothetical protein
MIFSGHSSSAEACGIGGMVNPREAAVTRTEGFFGSISMLGNANDHSIFGKIKVPYRHLTMHKVLPPLRLC